MQKIVPSLWFADSAAEAADFYVSVFRDGRIIETNRYPADEFSEYEFDLAGRELSVEFEVGGYRLIALNGGPQFPINYSISLMLNFATAGREELDRVWSELAEGGSVLMPLQAYDFSPYYGWLQDRYGMTWQLMLPAPGADPRPFVMPTLLFGGAAQNRAGEALAYYARTFSGARVGTRDRYVEPAGPAEPGSLRYGDLLVFGQWIALMDAAVPQDFTFTCGVSLVLRCSDQEELNRYWDELSAVPAAEQCGWCTDRYGVSWQLVPANLNELMALPGAFEKLTGMRRIEIDAFAEAPAEEWVAQA
ncbi:putative 3-demethylubiquinone-9 3-methyltransferase (glyoxalase superfamily) [Propionicimonas paludicola]|uniref:Putative 3-demethylubiquinone-9 3-methyltransferase (Glyoxalase superfamily) n=1 Tax=Propionicimonas paludicola TaxID=185243 RepID=A0A2A9CMQ0_9ACTN|nr:VOC family protein [Propionicimonas paludicola]PFG15598.1 putative 3-demethylubiquinone-9 3-methyltransferase (glyoxalase superfamily) [Propionicimonas paludicola]